MACAAGHASRARHTTLLQCNHILQQREREGAAGVRERTTPKCNVRWTDNSYYKFAETVRAQPSPTEDSRARVVL